MRRRRSGLNFGRRKKKVKIYLNLMPQMVTLEETTEVFLKSCNYKTVEEFFQGFLNKKLVYAILLRLKIDPILVNRFIYKVSDPKPNDIIVFLPNGNEKSHYYVKRVIAVPGDTVLIQNGAVYVNGELFDEKVDVSAIEEAGLASEELKLEDDEYFVLGDNRNNSEDSRYANIGNVKKDYIIGKAWFRVSPWKKFGFI